MAKARSPRGRGLRFGEKVRVILKRNAEARVEPSSPKALAKVLDEDDPKVYRALDSHAPKLDLAFKIARRLGESLDFLADPDRDFTTQHPGERWDRFVASLRPEERNAIADALSRSPDLRGLLLAYAERGRGGPDGPTATPTGQRP